MHLPIFIEVLQKQTSSDLQICRKIAAQMFRNNVSPLPFASSTYETAEVIHSLRRKDLEPALFVINTYWAEEILKDLDAVAGELPILLLTRRAAGSALDLQATSDDDKSCPLKDLDKRRIVKCHYGAKTSQHTADVVSKALVQFAQDGQFWHVQALSGVSSLRLRTVF